MNIITQSPQCGKFLISEPFLPDPNFKRSVVYITEHNNQGTVGYILNRPLDTTLGAVINDLGELETSVRMGGPVQLDTLHFIHRIDELGDEESKIAEGIYWGGNFEKLKVLINQKRVKAVDIQFFIGYSGWEVGQLEREIGENSWIVTEGPGEYIFSKKPESIWKDILSDMGSKFEMISNYPEDPTLN